jgi:hypothetical protein
VTNPLNLSPARRAANLYGWADRIRAHAQEQGRPLTVREWRRVIDLEQRAASLFTPALPAIADVCPALEQWRAEVLADRRRTPLEQAAAWELTALAAEIAGRAGEAATARRKAAVIVHRATRGAA